MGGGRRRTACAECSEEPAGPEGLGPWSRRRYGHAGGGASSIRIDAKGQGGLKIPNSRHRATNYYG